VTVRTQSGTLGTAGQDSPMARTGGRLPLRGWRGGDPLTRTTAALATNTVVTSALGVVFWLVASHRYSASQVGADSALLSSLLLLSTLTELNFNTALPRLLPQVRRRSRAVALCYLATGSAGALAAGAFVLVAPHLTASLHFLVHDGWLVLSLIVGLAVYNVFAVQDAVLVAAQRAEVVPVENAVFGVVKLVLMILLVGHLAGHGIFISWILAGMLLVIPINALLFGSVLKQPGSAVGTQSYLPLEGRRKLVRYLAHDWAAGLLGQGTGALLPLIVLAVLGRAVTGYFYIAFIVVTAVTSFSQSFSTSLLVEAAHDEPALDRLTRRTIIRYATVVIPALVVAVVIAPLALRVFGAEYSRQAGEVFRILLVATIPQAAVAIAMSVERIRGRAERVLQYQAVSAVAALALVIPLIHLDGLAGVGWAWLIAQLLAALLVIPTLRSALVQRPLPAPPVESGP
jgi:O-antigen/teichoic acid export membrane protein